MDADMEQVKELKEKEPRECAGDFYKLKKQKWTRNDKMTREGWTLSHRGNILLFIKTTGKYLRSPSRYESDDSSVEDCPSEHASNF